MKAIGLLLVIAGMVFIVPHTGGAEWVYLSTDAVVGVEWSYDIETLYEFPKGIINVWIKKEYTDEARSKLIKMMLSRGLNVKRYETMSHAINLFEINCVSRENRIITNIVYAADGGILHMSTLEHPHSDGWEPIYPGSMSESLYQVVCP